MSKAGRQFRAEAAADHHNDQVSGDGKAVAAKNLKELQQTSKQVSLDYALPAIINDTVQAIGQVLEVKGSFWEGLEKNDDRRQTSYQCKVLR